MVAIHPGHSQSPALIQAIVNLCQSCREGRVGIFSETSESSSPGDSGRYFPTAEEVFTNADSTVFRRKARVKGF